jgi:hypothetical protein
MDPGLHKPMGALLEAVSADLPVTCRVWLKRALHDLDGAGFIALTSPKAVGDIEREAERQAAHNT